MVQGWTQPHLDQVVGRELAVSGGLSEELLPK